MQSRLDGTRPGAIAELCECVGQWFRCSTTHAGGGRGNAMNPPARAIGPRPRFPPERTTLAADSLHLFGR
ncbi:hypothetical protein PC119_g9566 [Phytophthora cactorum]|nr:hypothetical protein PC119_g9566 [Phytophthora cactorum]